MKFFVAISFALLACAAADVSHLQSGYDYPAPVHEEVKSEPIAPQNTYVPPPPAPAPVAPQNTYVPPPPAPAVAPQNTYIPPAAPAPAPVAPIHEEIRSEPIAPAPAAPAPEPAYIPPAAAAPAPEPSASLDADGYHYKTVRRVVYRHRV
ncbi:uncharacterized protein LOC105212516 [Zeugodacus cucurbitae]|nr:uncharacterized protein LOC105212516 [Zeugodacus cucurbitae]